MAGTCGLISERMEKMVLNGIYNVAIYWPKEIQKAVRRALQLDYKMTATDHFQNRLTQYDISDVNWEDFINGEVVECEVKDGVVWKIITRTSSTKFEGEHNCAAIKLERGYGRPIARFITVWINRDNDNHRTIRRENYICGFRREARA